MTKEEVVTAEPGDQVVALHSNNCCWTAGKRYMLISTDVGLIFEPDCYHRYGDFINIGRFNREQFTLERKESPW